MLISLCLCPHLLHLHNNLGFRVTSLPHTLNCTQLCTALTHHSQIPDAFPWGLRTQPSAETPSLPTSALEQLHCLALPGTPLPSKGTAPLQPSLVQCLPLLLPSPFLSPHYLHCPCPLSTLNLRSSGRTTHTSPCYCHLPVLGH